ncbi:unnamed protein product [Boreogadus saida]
MSSEAATLEPVGLRRNRSCNYFSRHLITPYEKPGANLTHGLSRPNNVACGAQILLLGAGVPSPSCLSGGLSGRLPGRLPGSALETSVGEVGLRMRRRSTALHRGGTALHRGGTALQITVVVQPSRSPWWYSPPDHRGGTTLQITVVVQPSRSPWWYSPPPGRGGTALHRGGTALQITVVVQPSTVVVQPSSWSWWYSPPPWWYSPPPWWYSPPDHRGGTALQITVVVQPSRSPWWYSPPDHRGGTALQITVVVQPSRSPSKHDKQLAPSRAGSSVRSTAHLGTGCVCAGGGSERLPLHRGSPCGPPLAALRSGLTSSSYDRSLRVVQANRRMELSEVRARPGSGSGSKEGSENERENRPSSSSETRREDRGLGGRTEGWAGGPRAGREDRGLGGRTEGWEDRGAGGGPSQTGDRQDRSHMRGYVEDSITAKRREQSWMDGDHV